MYYNDRLSRMHSHHLNLHAFIHQNMFIIFFCREKSDPMWERAWQVDNSKNKQRSVAVKWAQRSVANEK